MKNLKVLIPLMLCALVFTACSSDKKDSRVMLNQSWTYSLQDPSAGSAEFKPLPADALGDLTKVIPGGIGYVYLENHFTVPESLRGQDIGCYLGRITMADYTTVNGFYIGGKGKFPPKEFSAWNETRCYNIPKEVLVSGDNVLRVKIWSDGESSIVSDTFIGEAEDAAHVATFNEFWNSKIHLGFAFLMIIMGAYHLFIYIKRTKDKENLIFAILNFISAIYLSVFYIQELPGFSYDGISFMMFQKVFSSGMPFILPFLVTSYINAFVHRQEKSAVLAARACFMLIPIVIVFLMPDYPTLHRARTLLQLAYVPPLLYILFILIDTFRKEKKETGTLLIGFSPLVFTVLFDLFIHNVLHLNDVPYTTSIGWQLVILVLLFIMASRFTNSRTEAEYLNEHLEKEVNDRTKELSESNKNLSSANSQLSTANAQLEEAQKKADKDMHLAEFVQRSFYAHPLPNFAEWDLAYHFSPMSGVSGDLYDFFIQEDQLKGIGLLDVSGHGISSGLVTMLAKTVIDRKFMEGLNKPFGKVVCSINESLIAEKGDIENYLTGVFLRVNGNKVEYVNAGHPRTYFRSGKTGAVVPIEVPGSQANTDSGILGINGLTPEFKAIGFTLQRGDSILLYTDCLNESRNIDGEQFGGERIAKAFNEAGNGGAEEKLRNVLNHFSNFTAGVPLNDDLTVIVLQKK